MAILNLNAGIFKEVPLLGLSKIIQNYWHYKLPLYLVGDNGLADRIFLPNAKVDAITYSKNIELTTGAIETGRTLTNAMINRPSSIVVDLVGEDGETLRILNQALEQGLFFYFLLQGAFVVYPLVIKDLDSNTNQNNINLCNISFVLEEIELSTDVRKIMGGLI